MILASSKLTLWGETSGVESKILWEHKSQLAEATKKLILAKEAATRGSSYEQVRMLKLEINELLDQESMMWIQRA